jgi:hypothetical protein
MAKTTEVAQLGDSKQQAAPLAKEIIDVLMRGLGTATQSLDPSILPAASLCIGWYLDGPPPRQCAIWYNAQ